jgi:hypothetical protein
LVRTRDGTYEDILVRPNFSVLQIWRRYNCALFLMNNLKNKLSCFSVPDTLSSRTPRELLGGCFLFDALHLAETCPSARTVSVAADICENTDCFDNNCTSLRAQPNILILQNFLVNLHPCTWHLFCSVFHFYLLSLVLYVVFLLSVFACKCLLLLL